MSGHSSLGERMKNQYEVRAQTNLPRRTYTVLRLDGKAFHTYTRGLKKPWDSRMAQDMANAAGVLCEQAQGAECAYVQSDEISVLLTDFASIKTDAWFDGNVQKIVSVASSIVTATFNQQRPMKTAYFDCRAFTIPDRVEVENYMIWRQQDCVRNSIAALAQAHFSHNELMGLKSDELQELLWTKKGINWSAQNPWFKNGVLVRRRVQTTDEMVRHSWIADAAPVFTQDRRLLSKLVPAYPEVG